MAMSLWPHFFAQLPNPFMYKLQHNTLLTIMLLSFALYFRDFYASELPTAVLPLLSVARF